MRYLGGHDELVVDDVVGGVAHTEQGAGRMEVTRHACPHVHVFTNALGANKGINNSLNVQLKISGSENGTLCVAAGQMCVFVPANMGAVYGQSKTGQRS